MAVARWAATIDLLLVADIARVASKASNTLPHLVVRRRESILSESDDRFRFRQCKKVADVEKNVLDLRWYERGGNRPVVDN